MATSHAWASDLTFTDRMNNTVKITASYRNLFPDQSPSEAQAEGRSIETSILSQATSKEDYHRLCRQKIAQLQNASATTTSQTAITPQASSRADKTPEPGQKIGPYANATFHQRGTFSTVYKASSDSPPPQLLALKLIFLPQSQPPHNPFRESRILHHARHPSVIPLISTLRLDGSQLLLVFPFLPLDLDTWLHTYHTPNHPFQHARAHLRDLFSALAHLHFLGIIHRDVKPSNILLASPSGPAYLADFGIAWMPEDDASEPVDRKITDVGTTCYRPPELLFGHSQYGCSLDLWAAGCVTAELFTPGQKTLFDSGALGSELALIQSIFRTLGTPTLETWPEAAQFSSWGKVDFYSFPPRPWAEILPGAPEDALDLVSQLVRYESGTRLVASDALNHPFLNGMLQLAGGTTVEGYGLRTTSYMDAACSDRP